VLLAGGGDGQRSGPRSDGQLALLDPRTGAVERRIDVGATPQGVAVAAGAAWIVDADEQLVRRVDRKSGAVDNFSTGATPADVAAAGAEVWVVESRRSGRTQVAGPRPATVVRIDPRARTVRARVDLPTAGETVSRTSDDHVAVGAGSIWAVGPSGTVVRVDPRSQSVTATIRGFEATSVAAGEGGVWLLGENGEVALVDERRNRIARRGRIETAAAGAIASGAGSAWVTSGEGAVWRVQDGPKLVTRRIEVGAGAGDAAFGAGALWVTNPVRGTVSRIDPATNRAGPPIAVGGVPRGIAVDAAGPVVTIDGTLPSAATRAGGVPLEGCGPVISRGRPGKLIVADLPLQGGLQFSTQQMALVAEYVLRGRGFRAGRHSLGLQVCDHSVARTGLFDEAKCASNARAYVDTPSVIGVVGPVNTPCATASLAITNRADLAVISPSASSPELTHDRALYPTGRRNFTRTGPPDDREMVALAQLAKNLGAQRVAIASDGVDYGAFVAGAFQTEAQRLGLEVDRVKWRSPRFATRPDAVFLGGLLDTGGARALRAVRRELGPEVPILVPGGFTPTPLLAERAGPAVRNTYLAANTLITESLPARGRRFVREFGASLPGAEIEPSSVYTAAAMQTLLDAIAVSDGTRDSVRRKLLAARSKTVVGDVSFDANGDPRATGVTILRMEPGRTAGPFEDAVLDRVVTAG
jgi:branched-chain amino acid transport system substrate-binding protein